jgi:hypothetical protein
LYLDGGLLCDAFRILKDGDGQVDGGELLVLRLLCGLCRCSYETFALACKLNVVHLGALLSTGVLLVLQAKGTYVAKRFVLIARILRKQELTQQGLKRLYM